MYIVFIGFIVVVVPFTYFCLFNDIRLYLSAQLVSLSFSHSLPLSSALLYSPLS